jgi:hypothetical protein
MPYVGRDQNGNIIAVSTNSSPLATELMAEDSLELHGYLAQLSPPAVDALARSDQDLIRVVEDIIDTLIEKNVIRFTDLPEAAQHKLVHRRSLRRSKIALDLLGEDEDKTIPVIKL